jgi:hypothetical protein
MHEVVLNRDRDFFLRLSSFSLPTKGGDQVDRKKAEELRDALRQRLPWLADEALDLRKQQFKDSIACALCCALPVFDLVIVDEGHNLKHGFGTDVSARNRLLALAFGRRDPKEVDPRLRPHYGLRAKRLLLLSATPVEESYQQLWNQLDIFNLGNRFHSLNSSDTDEDHKKVEAAKFLLRRVTTVRVGDADLTKNQYRREWRRGGVSVYDEPIQVDDPRQRLAVALVQKKVSELLQNDRFGSAFQIGMLASFESFLETAKTKRNDDETANFDDPDQARTAISDLEREGIDVADVNRLAKDYRERFRKELPHPKMDALVESLASSWQTGEKALVFVRRIASVTELKRKLDERYDQWLIDRLRGELPESVQQRFKEVVDQYYRERLTQRAAMRSAESQSADDESPVGKDRGGTDSFFAWYFRGDGPARVISGANIQRRFVQRGASYATFFEDNYVAEILGCAPGTVELNLATVLEVDREKLRSELRQNPATGTGSERDDPHEWFTAPTAQGQITGFRTRELRAQTLAAAARLGHAFVDLYIMTIRRLGSLDLRAQEQIETTRADAHVERIGEYLDLLEEQMRVPRQQRGWRAFDELAELAENFDLILDVNAPDARTQPLSQTVRTFGTLFGTQQPVGGMSGQINRTLVRQFRLPGYPLVLVSTDLLQEGEDLHTFCSGVYHYGISWTSSAMEQRIGRIDRVCSQTDRRLSSLTSEPQAKDKLQVYFPYLEDTVEVLQVRRILERMNNFLRLMHEGLTPVASESSKIRTDREFLRSQRVAPQIQESVQTAFPVRPELLQGGATALAIARNVAERIAERFSNLRSQDLPGLFVDWEPLATPGILLGTAKLDTRCQPFRLQLRSLGSRPLIRCLSPVGRVLQDDRTKNRDQQNLLGLAARHPMRVSVTPGRQEDSFDVSVVGDVLLAEDASTDALRAATLVRRVVEHADFLEQRLLPENDAALNEFRLQLIKELQDDT